jgi:hypothetical protein
LISFSSKEEASSLALYEAAAEHWLIGAMKFKFFCKETYLKYTLFLPRPPPAEPLYFFLHITKNLSISTRLQIPLSLFLRFPSLYLFILLF